MDELVRAVQVYAVDNGVEKATSAEETSLTISLTKDGVKGAVSNGTPAAIADGSTLKKAFDASVPNWNKIVRKSSQWGTNGDANPTVTLSISKEGDVKIETKSPDDFETYK